MAADSSSLLSGNSALALGGSAALGAGALGLTLGMGESPLPWEFGQVASNAPTMFSQGGTLFNTGMGFTNQGQQALEMAQQGQLTDPQKAQLSEFDQSLKNQAAQLYAGQGRNINQDTSAISTYADIDAKVNAMAQQEIQSTIALGLGETQAGASFAGQALGYESAANQALIAAGTAQLQQDKDYSDSLSSVFGSIFKMAGTIGGAAIGGPAGAAVGGTLAGALDSGGKLG